MKNLLRIAIVAIVALGPAHAAWGGSSPTERRLSSYLGKVKPLNGGVVAAETFLIKAEKASKHGQNNTNPAIARKELTAALLHAAKALSRITPPATLKNANAALVASLRLEARRADSRADRLRRQWRSAVVSALRRAGVAVPKWVTLVRDPLA